MSPPAASATARRSPSAKSRAAARKRRATQRRRRGFAAALFAFVAIIGVLVATPLLRDAVNELTLPLENADVIRQQAAEKRLDPALIAAVIYAETKFIPRTSVTGAEGLMQIEPQTAEFLAHLSGATSFTVADLGSPQINIAYGSYYLRYLLDHYRGDEMLAVAAYNGGMANVDRWLVQARDNDQTFSADDIPFPETRAYVQRVLQAQQDYRNTYAVQLGYVH
jgi:soluble lytic murein transglycosylase